MVGGIGLGVGSQEDRGSEIPSTTFWGKGGGIGQRCCWITLSHTGGAQGDAMTLGYDSVASRVDFHSRGGGGWGGQEGGGGGGCRVLGWRRCPITAEGGHGQE